jgi:pimeloyl-ACP methyl ester carboxylesterase
MNKHFVLIHGAWHGGWCREGVIQALKKAGYTAEALTLPGQNPGDDRSQVTFDSYVDRIVETLRRQSRPVVLVGHSSAGFLLQTAAPQSPEKIERLIFLNASILPDGKSQFDLVPPEAAQGMTAAAGASFAGVTS